MALIEVRPIEKERWHGNTGKNSIRRPVKIEALYNVKTGRYNTGLSTEDEERLSKLLGQDVSNIFIKDKPHPFWSTSGVVKLSNTTQIFDDSIPKDEVAIKLMKASELVANSMKDYQDGLYPDATHVIFDQREEIEIKAAKAQIKSEVYIETSKLSRDRKIEIIQVLTNRGMRKQSDDFITVELTALIEKSPEEVLRVIKTEKETTKIHAMILEALDKNVLRKEGSSFYYMDDQLGFDLNTTINYFKDPSNQKLKAEIIAKMK